MYSWIITLLTALALCAASLIVDSWRYFTRFFFIARFGITTGIRKIFKRRVIKEKSMNYEDYQRRGGMKQSIFKVSEIKQEGRRYKRREMVQDDEDKKLPRY